MKRRVGLLIFLVLSTGCVSSSFHDVLDMGYGLSVTKQKQRIVMLQKRLEVAEKEWAKVSHSVEEIRQELYQSQLTLIRRQIESYEQKIRKKQEDPTFKIGSALGDVSLLFLKEREMLQAMMEDGPSPESLEAQAVLDRILRMITDLKTE